MTALFTLLALWQPPDLRSAQGALRDVLSRYASPAAPIERKERYVYRWGAERYDVDVAEKGDDYRVTVHLRGREYTSGRYQGARWRADANGIAHLTQADLQGDPADRFPQSVVPFDLRHCSLAGRSTKRDAWIVEDAPPGDAPHWFYVDAKSGAIVREITREGQQSIDIAFDDFAPGDVPRPQHWRIHGNLSRDELDVVRLASRAEPVAHGEVAETAAHRTFNLPAGAETVQLPSRFDGADVAVDASVDGHRGWFALDSGTASITLSESFAHSAGLRTDLGHANVPRFAVGPATMRDVSVLTLPARELGRINGILGYDFFFGHVVHIDYVHSLVELLTPAAAERVFADPTVTTLDSNVDNGLPLVAARFGPAAGDDFAIDTGSPHLNVLRPFVERNSAEIAAHWTPAHFLGRGRTKQVERYVEGAVALEARRAASFAFAGATFSDIVVGVETPYDGSDALDIPFDGIIGTDELRFFDLWFDYDRERLGVRRNARR